MMPQQHASPYHPDVAEVVEVVVTAWNVRYIWAPDPTGVWGWHRALPDAQSAPTPLGRPIRTKILSDHSAADCAGESAQLHTEEADLVGGEDIEHSEQRLEVIVFAGRQQLLLDAPQ